MVKQLDLEEQEQLDELKHFWNQYGSYISAALVVILLSLASWNGYQYWQRSQGAQASVMYDAVEHAAQSGDSAQLTRALGDMRSHFGNTIYADQAALLAAKTFNANGNNDAAREALGWVADHASDVGYQSLARLRLAGVLMQEKSYDAALKQLDGKFQPEFEALANDRRGDILQAQGHKAEAIEQYRKAYAGLDATTDYRRLVEVKLNALGVDVQTAAALPETKP